MITNFQKKSSEASCHRNIRIKIRKVKQKYCRHNKEYAIVLKEASEKERKAKLIQNISSL